MPLDGPPEEMPLDGPPEEAVPEDAMDAVPLEDVVPLEEAAPAGRVSEEEGAGKEEQTAAEAAETDDADYEEPFEDDFWRDSVPSLSSLSLSLSLSLSSLFLSLSVLFVFARETFACVRWRVCIDMCCDL